MTRTHDEWTDRLSAHLDGDLPPGEAQAVERHLGECPSCRRVLEELEAVREAARGLLPRAPERDLWPLIEERLGEDPLEEKVIPLRSQRPGVRVAEADSRRLSLTPLRAIAAALVLVAGGWMAGSALAPSGGAVPGSTPGSDLTLVADGAAGGAGAPSERLAALERSVRERLHRLEPETRETLLRNLEVIDRAIRESMEALAVDPGSEYLRSHLGGAMERKRGYLERMSALLEV